MFTAYAKEMGRRIAQARKVAGLTSADLGIAMGISGSMVSQWECAKKCPTLPTLKRIADACGTTVARLIPPDLLGETTPSSINEYQKAAARTIDESLLNWEIESHALHGMVSEVGEIHSLFQKVYQGHAVDSTHLKKEVGDLLWFVAEFCTSLGWEMADAAQMNIDKLKARYPGGFDAERSLHRKEGDV